MVWRLQSIDLFLCIVRHLRRFSARLDNDVRRFMKRPMIDNTESCCYQYTTS